MRWTALDGDVNIAAGITSSCRSRCDKVVGASEEGPILVAGQRGGFKFVAMGSTCVRATCRSAWRGHSLLVNSINFFTDEELASTSRASAR